MTTGDYGYAKWTSQPVVSSAIDGDGGLVSEKTGDEWTLTIVEMTVPADGTENAKDTYVDGETGMWTGSLPTSRGQSFDAPGDPPPPNCMKCVQCSMDNSSFGTPGTPYFDVIMVFQGFKKKD